MKKLFILLGLLFSITLSSEGVTARELANSYDSFLNCSQREDNLFFEEKISETNILVGIKEFSESNIKTRNGVGQKYKSFHVLDKKVFEIDEYQACLTRDEIITFKPDYLSNQDDRGCPSSLSRGSLSRKDLTGSISYKSRLECEVIDKGEYFDVLRKLLKAHKDTLEKNKL